MDVVLERDGRPYPIELKCKSHVTRHDVRGIRAFRETYPKENIMMGLVIYAGNDLYRVDEHTIALPWNLKRADSGVGA